MSGNFFLDTAVLAVSLFNTMVLLWLGIVVLLSAERKSWGIWLTGGGLLSSGIFFMVHTAIIARGLRAATLDLDVLWHFGWLPIIAAPLAWYFCMLWYAGVLDARATTNQNVRRIHFAALVFNVACALCLCFLILVADALPSFTQVVTFGREDYSRTPFTPLLILVYAIYNIACMALSMHALRHPAPSARWMGDLARQRAQPWLAAASVVLMIVSLLVSAFVVFLYFFLDTYLITDEQTVRNLLAWFDLMVSALIATATVLIGKATVSYEIFTGQVLPRRGFLRQWRRAIILAAGYSTLVAATLTLQLNAIYALLLATLLLVVFYALVAVRAFGERERVVMELRPFLQAARGRAQNDNPERAAFDSLCANVLNVRVAYLCPRIPFATALAFPANVAPPCEKISALAIRLDAPAMQIVPAQFGGAQWAIPLTDERGMIGALLLGERADASLYTQEEMEIARAAAERIVQAQASAELTRRLLELQRGRLATTQVVDRRARRELHDEILPQLHTAMLNLSAGETDAALHQLQDTHRAVSNLVREMPTGASPQIERCGVLGALRHTVDDEFANAFDTIQWETEPRAETAAQALPALNAEVLYAAAREAIRNAAKHARGDNARGALHLTIRARYQDGLVLDICDDGIGLAETPRGTGHGMQLHSTMMAVIGGTLTLERVGAETRARLFVPPEK